MVGLYARDKKGEGMIYTFGYTGKKPSDLKAEAERLDAVVVDIRFSPNSRVPHWRMTTLLPAGTITRQWEETTTVYLFDTGKQSEGGTYEEKRT